jgi:hypothetical protein
MSDTQIGKYVIVRTQNAGCFSGTLVSREGQEARLENARRLWYWAGAASLSGLAIHGTSLPNDCKFAVPVSITVLEVIEVIDTTTEAEEIIKGVKEWKA